jgi:hypothetical protein
MRTVCYERVARPLVKLNAGNGLEAGLLKPEVEPTSPGEGREECQWGELSSGHVVAKDASRRSPAKDADSISMLG